MALRSDSFAVYRMCPNNPNRLDLGTLLVHIGTVLSHSSAFSPTAESLVIRLVATDEQVTELPVGAVSHPLRQIFEGLRHTVGGLFFVLSDPPVIPVDIHPMSSTCPGRIPQHCLKPRRAPAFSPIVLTRFFNRYTWAYRVLSSKKWGGTHVHQIFRSKGDH